MATVLVRIRMAMGQKRRQIMLETLEKLLDETNGGNPVFEGVPEEERLQARMGFEVFRQAVEDKGKELNDFEYEA